MSIPLRPPFPQKLTRRGLLISGGAGLGLMVAWSLWPRHYPASLTLSAEETGLGGYVKIHTDGSVTLIAPEVEMGQGTMSLFAQMLADELGADWSMIALETAPPHPFYALPPPPDWEILAPRFIDRALHKHPVQITSEAFAPRRFEAIARDAGATARVLLCKAAARRWKADWRACETAEGFVLLGQEKMSFGALAQYAANEEPEEHPPLRPLGQGRLAGVALPRLDTPAKVTGRMNFAADIRLPNMVFAATSILASTPDARRQARAKARPDVIDVIPQAGWIAVIGKTWWAARRALDDMIVGSPAPIPAPLDERLDTAFQENGKEIDSIGDVSAVFESGSLVRAEFTVDPAHHAAPETLCATAVFREDKLELWVPTQTPEISRQRAAKAANLSADDVIIHPMAIGGSFGRAYEQDAVIQAATLAMITKAPVQLTWSRREDEAQDRQGAAASIRMVARLDKGQVIGWRARIAAPASLYETSRRLFAGDNTQSAREKAAGQAEAEAVSGARPPYAIPNLSIVHHPVNSAIATGKMRGGADRACAFAREIFMDDLAELAGVDPFSFRMTLLGKQPRLAACLARVTSLGNWEGGGIGSQQGLSCHNMQGSFIAVLAEGFISDLQEPKVTRLVAVADLGRVTNPDIARQQVESGLLFGLALALGKAGTLGMADTPKMDIEILPSRAEPGALGEISVAAVAPAVVNALWAGSGRRIRTLPIRPE